MKHELFKVTSVKLVAPLTLEISFDDGITKTINFEPVLYGEMYSPLRDAALFDSVRIDPEVHTIVWSNGADFDPAILRHWEELVEEISRRAKAWEVEAG